MESRPQTQHDQALALLKKHGMLRLSEFKLAGITTATVSRMAKKGALVQLSRGLYQLPDAPLDPNHSLAEAAKRVPKGVICLTSALAFHELTDTIPSKVWVAIGIKDWRPRVMHPPLQFVRFGADALASGIEEHMIEGVLVRITNPARTIVDLFRYRQSAGTRYQRSPGLSLALEGLRAALRTRKAAPAEIARYAQEVRIWKVVEPYLQSGLDA